MTTDELHLPPPDELQWEAVDDEFEARLQFNRQVHEEASRLRVRQAARELLEAEKRGPRPLVPHVDGCEFISAGSGPVPSIWGYGTEVAWAAGEAFLITGLPGSGKTTLAGQLVRARLGLGSGAVLGLPVARTGKRVLYLAMDRARQIARSMARLFDMDDPETREILRERLRVRPGPPPADLAIDTDALARMAAEEGADTVVVDSIKDAFLGVSEDGPAAAYNRCRQQAIAEGVELLELHHMRKNAAGGGKPRDLSDVYGSAWVTAGAGSVVTLNGDPGDPIVDLVHLKKPVDEIGPWKILHDPVTGLSSVYHSTDLLSLARVRGQVTAKDAAEAMFDTDKPSPNEIEKARRKLSRLVESGHLYEAKGDRTANRPTLWHHIPDMVEGASPTFTQTFTRPSGREGITSPSTPSREQPAPAHQDHHADLHDLHAPGPSRTHPPLEGGGGGSGCPKHPATPRPDVCPDCSSALAAS